MVNQEIVKRIVGYAETYVSEAPDKGLAVDEFLIDVRTLKSRLSTDGNVTHPSAIGLAMAATWTQIEQAIEALRPVDTER